MIAEKNFIDDFSELLFVPLKDLIRLYGRIRAAVQVKLSPFASACLGESDFGIWEVHLAEDGGLLQAEITLLHVHEARVGDNAVQVVPCLLPVLK